MYQGPGWSGCFAVSSLRHTCTGSHRSRGLNVAAIWNHIGKSVLQSLFSLSSCFFFSGSAFLVFCFSSIPPLYFSSIFSLSTVITVWWVPECPCVWGLMAGLLGLLAMGASYCLVTGWSQWRPLDIPGTHLPLSSMQLLNNKKTNELRHH